MRSVKGRGLSDISEEAVLFGAGASPHLPLDKVTVPLAVHLLVLQEDAVAQPGAHEVVVTGAGGQTAAHRGSRPLAVLAALGRETHMQ